MAESSSKRSILVTGGGGGVTLVSLAGIALSGGSGTCSAPLFRICCSDRSGRATRHVLEPQGNDDGCWVSCFDGMVSFVRTFVHTSSSCAKARRTRTLKCSCRSHRLHFV
jgi:hypothetical protein